MDEALFSYQTMKMTDEEFWQHIEQLDNLSENIANESGGFSLKIQTGTGKTYSVPFVRFSKTIPEKGS
jgi:hypothetical protein